MEQRTALTAVPEDGTLEYIASSCGGDLRKAMNAVEVLFAAGIPQDGKLPLTLADAKEVTQQSALRADRDGDNYYDLLSALHKSIRGSDPDAACHYLARLLEAGQMPSACRRLMCVGGGGRGAGLSSDPAHRQGLRGHGAEAGNAGGAASPGGCRRADGHQSKVQFCLSCHSMRRWTTCARESPGISPGTCRTSTRIPTRMEREQGYLYPHNYPNHWVKQQYLPDELVGAHYYEYGPNKLEQAAKQYWDSIKKE